MKNNMTLNEYQKAAMKTCLPTSNNFTYMMLNLVGEVGEFASKIAKAIRKENAYIGGPDDAYPNDLCYGQAFIQYEDAELKKEAGDIAWQLAGLCTVMGWDLESVCRMNLDKLASRQERGKIDGDGDNR